MEHNGENKIQKTDYFDLREKRLKLVYKILYVIVAIWVAVILNINGKAISPETVPVYAFILASCSLIIIKIVKYAIMELRCMKVVGSVPQLLKEQTEERYERIWKSVGLELSFCAELMLGYIIFDMVKPSVISDDALIYISAVCSTYFLIISIIGFFKKNFSNKAISILDTIGSFVGVINAYAICAFVCMVVAK